ncbi:MAG: BACON domain-containing protein, partial [Bacteroidales bacterium]|nr:BACON domain-containing protein [Bacteroidales bacterium]
MKGKFILGLAAVLFALCACDDNDKNDNGFDEQYYAEHASISSSDTKFTANSDGGDITFKAAGGEVVVSVICGTDWDVRNSASDVFTAVCDWNNGTLTVSAGQNTIEAERTATLSLVTVGLQLEFAKITITQNAYGAPEITVSS